MSGVLSRREMLLGGLGAAGLMAGGLHRECPGQSTAKPSWVDRSGQSPSAPVAIGRCASYDPQVLRQAMDAALRLAGGIGKLVNGKSVTIKMNLTGGPAAGKIGGLPPYRTYHVHPNVVAALCAALVDAGARRITLVESQYSLKTPEELLSAAGWDINGIKAAGGHRVAMLDTRNRGRYPNYSRLPVPWGGFMHAAYDLNPIYEKTDVYISLAKLKDHANAGVTGACKNNFGIAPTSLYGGDAPNENTTDYRGEILHYGRKKVPAGVPAELDHGLKVGDFDRRVPRVTADLAGARPIHLSVIDGIETNRGGEGPWIDGAEPIRPNLLLVGLNPVCTDAVCAAVMGYDPRADHFVFPFQGENHLKLLASVGVGTNDPARIEVRGLSIKEALCPFNPKRLPVRPPVTWKGYYCSRYA